MHIKENEKRILKSYLHLNVVQIKKMLNMLLYIYRKRENYYIYIYNYSYMRKKELFPFATQHECTLRHILSEINHTDKDKQTYH